MILDRFHLDGRAAVVTAASRGLGAASALALAEAGADVLVAARSADLLEEVADGIRAVGRRAEVVVTDLNDLDALAALPQAATAAFGRLDVVVNNLGGAMPRPFMDTSPGFLERSFHFNVSTAHALTRAAVPLLLAHGDGAVINISSTVGRLPGRGYLGYGTAKAALSHYTRLAARDLAPHIRVNGIAVGSAATSALDMVVNDEGMRTQVESVTPLGRIADPVEIASVVVFLASPAASYLTGKVLEADGGLEVVSLDLGIPDL